MSFASDLLRCVFKGQRKVFSKKISNKRCSFIRHTRIFINIRIIILLFCKVYTVRFCYYVEVCSFLIYMNVYSVSVIIISVIIKKVNIFRKVIKVKVQILYNHFKFALLVQISIICFLGWLEVVRNIVEKLIALEILATSYWKNFWDGILLFLFFCYFARRFGHRILGLFGCFIFYLIIWLWGMSSNHFTNKTDVNIPKR